MGLAYFGEPQTKIFIFQGGVLSLLPFALYAKNIQAATANKK